MKFTDEDVKKIEKFIEIRNKGYYASGSEVTDVYNRVLEKRVSSTMCSSCLRQRISELETALNRFKKELETNRKQEEQTVPKDETITKVEKPKKNIRRKKDVVS